MPKERVSAFSDGVIAIIISIMVLELKVPHGADWTALAKLTPGFLAYVLSFVYVAIYWNNHHHLLHACKQVDGAILWANLHLLFWLSLVPFATGWLGENHFQRLPTALYGAVLLAAAIAYYILQRLILRQHDAASSLARAFARDFKGRLSPVLYFAAVALAGIAPWFSHAIYVAVALMWLVPDRRIEQVVDERVAD